MFCITTPPTPPTKHTTDPIERSTLPPVKIHNNIPVVNTNTYAFCEIKFDTFCGYNILPFVRHAKNNVTHKSTKTIVYF